MSAVVLEPRPVDGASLQSPDWGKLGWMASRIAVLAITLALIVALVVWPAAALGLLWSLLIPILPASFLIAPQLWRGLCPLATLDQWTGTRWGHRTLTGRPLLVANAIGILLLVLLVPARRLLFNENGPAMALLVAGVATAAMVLGFVFSRRAGFCNSICPVLPVERLYGQYPFVRLDNRRCDRCTRCTPKGCIDVNPRTSIGHAFGQSPGRHQWLNTCYGVFAAALPGFIIGYFTLSNVPLSSAAEVYAWIAVCSLIGYLATTLAVRLLGLSRSVALALLAAASVALYYWWVAASVVGFLGLPLSAIHVIRVAAILLVAAWLVRAWPRLPVQKRRIALL